MGKPKEPQPAKLFMSLIALENDIFHQGVKDLNSTFGEADFISERFPFDFTDYYTQEMGKPLFRHFITFERLIPIHTLPDIKETTNRLEEKYGGFQWKPSNQHRPGIRLFRACHPRHDQGLYPSALSQGWHLC